MAVAAIAIVVVLAAGGGGGDGAGVKGSGNIFPSGGSVPEQKVFDLQKAAAAAGCELSSNKATSREHIQDLNEKVKYKQNPPTSGKHYAVPAEDGLYNGEPPPGHRARARARARPRDHLGQADACRARIASSSARCSTRTATR